MKKKTTKIIKKLFIRLFVLIVIAGAIIAGAYLYFEQKSSSADETKSEQKKDLHTEFLMELYDKIQKNYWQKITDKDLSELYKLALTKAQEDSNLATSTATTSDPLQVSAQGKKEIKLILKKELENLNPENKKELTINIANLVLANLQPLGRSGLYTTKKVAELSNTVQNIDPEINLYQELGVEKDSPPEKIDDAYEEKSKKLKETVKVLGEKTQLTPEEQKEKIAAEQKLAQIDRARETLSEPEKRKKYDESGIEATAQSNILAPGLAYLQLKKFSPTTFEEFVNELDKLEDEPQVKTLIFDLRDNIGGSIDYLPYFLGVFLGNNQYAYDWYHQEEYTLFRTKADKMPIIDKLRKMIILGNEVTQSSAELMLATLKRYNLGLFVGTKTKGWGTIEKVYPLENQIDPQQETYSLYLVHSVTLRDNDGQPIEGRGVDPDIDITNKDWEQQLTDYFEDEELTETVKELLEK